MLFETADLILSSNYSYIFKLNRQKIKTSHEDYSKRTHVTVKKHWNFISKPSLQEKQQKHRNLFLIRAMAKLQKTPEGIN